MLPRPVDMQQSVPHWRSMKFWGVILGTALTVSALILLAFGDFAILSESFTNYRSRKALLFPVLGPSFGSAKLSGAQNTWQTAHTVARAPRKQTSSKATEAEFRALLSSVARDLEPWKDSGISLEMVEKAYCTVEIGESMRFQVINGTLYLVGATPNFQSRSRTIQTMMMEVQQRFHLPDVDFVLSTGDQCKRGDMLHRSHDGNMTRCTKLAPIISSDKRHYESQCVAAPDFSFGGWPEAFLPPWSEASTWMRAANERQPWVERDDLIFWRGGDTNEGRSVVDKSELVQGSGMADIHLMDWGVTPEEFAERFIALPNHCHHKLLLHLAGVGYSARLKYLMACGSAVVFPNNREHNFDEFWYHMLEHGHNIMLTDNVDWGNLGSPMLDAIKQLRSNLTWAEAVGKAGAHLALEVLHPENIFAFWAELIGHYSALMRFKVEKHADAVALDEALMRPPKHFTVEQRTCRVC